MAMKPCSQYGCKQFVKTGQRFCNDHKSSRLKTSRKNMPEYRKWYSKKDWMRSRISFLKQNPLCVQCQKNGKVEPAWIVDHVIAHKGDKELFWNVDNWQALCKSCHDRKTYYETLGNDGTKVGIDYFPDYLGESTIPITIVCGPSASGKTTYVNNNKANNALVIDIDDIIYDMTGERYPDNRDDYLQQAIATRNDILLSLTYTTDYESAWLITTAAKKEHRIWWKDKLKATKVIVLDTSKEKCIQRVMQDKDRESNRYSFIGLINRWWENYTR